MTKTRRPRALRFKTGHRRIVASRVGTAAEVLGTLTPGVSLTGATAGQFSAIDALEHIANELVNADCMVSTWTTGVYDVERAAAMRENGNLRRVRMLLDRATFEKSPHYAGPLIEALGADAFRCLSVHAKIIIVRGERGTAAFRSSMNLNKNLRTEQFDLDVCDVIGAFWAEWFEELWDEAGTKQDNVAIIKAVFDRWEQSGRFTPERPSKRSKFVRPSPWRDPAA